MIKKHRAYKKHFNKLMIYKRMFPYIMFNFNLDLFQDFNAGDTSIDDYRYYTQAQRMVISYAKLMLKRDFC